MKLVLDRHDRTAPADAAPAADPANDAIFAARAALGRAHAMRDAADTQIQTLSLLVERLRRPPDRSGGP